jgi:hypothetical protein
VARAKKHPFAMNRHNKSIVPQNPSQEKGKKRKMQEKYK